MPMVPCLLSNSSDPNGLVRHTYIYKYKRKQIVRYRTLADNNESRYLISALTNYHHDFILPLYCCTAHNNCIVDVLKTHFMGIKINQSINQSLSLSLSLSLIGIGYQS